MLVDATPVRRFSLSEASQDHRHEFDMPERRKIIDCVALETTTDKAVHIAGGNHLSNVRFAAQSRIS